MAARTYPVASTDQDVAHREAYDLLRLEGHFVQEILRVHPDSILFEGVQQRAMTAWKKEHGDRTLIVTELGFPAEPSVFTLKKLTEMADALQQLESD